MGKRIYDSKDNFGGYFEDFSVGDVYKHWPGKTITESDNHLFSLITMNTSPLHIDENYMLGHQHGQILVCGPLVLSLVVGMSVSDTSGKAVANLEYESIKHFGPVFIGDTIYSESQILACDLTRSKKRGIIFMETIGLNQKDEKIISLKRRFLVPVRPDGV